MSSKTITKIRRTDNGRRMSIEEFELAEAEECQHFELSRGVEHSIRPPAGYRARLLPGFEFSIERAFQASSGT